MIPRDQEFDKLPGSRHDRTELQNIASINFFVSSSTWKCENPQHQANSDRFFRNATTSSSTCIICSYLRYMVEKSGKNQNKTKTCCFEQRIWVSLQKLQKKPQKKPKHEKWQTIIANTTNTNREATYNFKLKQQQSKTKQGDANQPSANERDHKQRKHSKFRANDQKRWHKTPRDKFKPRDSYD